MIKTDISKLELKKNIIIKGAQVHNLKNVDVTILRNKLVVITGLSGSGKSSLAFDTCMPIDNDVIWKVYHRTPINFWED
jgi:excinuclease ABC subunit A